MIEIYKTFDGVLTKIEKPEAGCWINVVAPSESERKYLTEEIKLVPEFLKQALDEEESPHIDYDDDCASCSAFVEYRRCDYLQGPCLAIDDDLHSPAGKGS